MRVLIQCDCCSVAKLCPTLCNPIVCSTPGFPVLHSISRICSNSCPLNWSWLSHHLFRCDLCPYKNMEFRHRHMPMERMLRRRQGLPWYFYRQGNTCQHTSSSEGRVVGWTLTRRPALQIPWSSWAFDLQTVSRYISVLGDTPSAVLCAAVVTHKYKREPGVFIFLSPFFFFCIFKLVVKDFRQTF